MRTAIGFLAIAAAFLVAEVAHAQLLVPSYERNQQFMFCDSIPQSDELTVPFDFINKGSAPLTIDSAWATGDTADFYSNVLPASTDRYLNPVMWKFIDGRALNPSDVFFNNFFFAPRTPGDKRLAITVYYHDAVGSHTTGATMLFHTTNSVAGLGLLRSTIDTIKYADSIGYKSVTYDRTIMRDVIYNDTLIQGSTLRAATEGEKRIDLTACGNVTVTAVDLVLDTPADSFQVFLPPVPFTFFSGDSLLLDYIYIARAIEIPTRTAMATFHTSGGGTATFRLNLVTPKPAGVDADHGVAGASDVAMEGLPNPFRESATLRLGTPRNTRARLSVSNQLGQEVAVLFDGMLEVGTHEYRFDASGLPAGVYYARYQLGTETRTCRLLLVQ